MRLVILTALALVFAFSIAAAQSSSRDGKRDKPEEKAEKNDSPKKEMPREKEHRKEHRKATIICATSDSCPIEFVSPSASLAVTPRTHNFGTVTIGTSQEVTVTIENTGTGLMTVNSIDIAGDKSAFTFNDKGSDLCSLKGQSLGAKSRCYLKVIFKPKNSSSFETKMMIRSSDAGTSPIEVVITGRGAVSEED